MSFSKYRYGWFAYHFNSNFSEVTFLLGKSVRYLISDQMSFDKIDMSLKVSESQRC